MEHAPAPNGVADPRLRPVGWRRLWQPRRPLFWLMVVFNLLSSAMGVVLRGDMLSLAGMLMVGALAVANALAGMWLAWRLLRGD